MLAAVPPRPVVSAPTSTATGAPTATGSRQNGTATMRPATAVIATAPKPAASPRVEEFPIIPSNDFLKWMAESLKGLNNSVNCGFDSIVTSILTDCCELI